MKLVLVSALFAAVLVCSSYAQSCTDIAKCMPDPNMMSSNDIGKVCGEARKSLNCYEEFFDSCKDAMGSMASTVESGMKAQRRVLDEHCSVEQENTGPSGCGAVQVSLLTLMAALLAYMFL